MIITGIVLCTLLLTGCGTAKLKNGEQIIAKLDGYTISADDLFKEMKNKYARNVMIELIDTYILNKEYKDEDYASATQSQVDSYKAQTGDSFLETIKSQFGLNSEKEFYNYVLMFVKQQQAIKDYAKTVITESEIKSFYDKDYISDYKSSHILIKADSTDAATVEEQTAAEEKALKEAKNIINKLNKGEDFAALAKKYSDDEGTKEKGGDLGWVSQGSLVTEYEKAIVSLKNGEYTKEPVKSAYGYHVILRVDMKKKPSLKTATAKITELLANKLVQTDTKLSVKAMENLRKEYNLSIKDSGLDDQYKQYIEYLKNAK